MAASRSRRPGAGGGGGNPRSRRPGSAASRASASAAPNLVVPFAVGGVVVVALLGFLMFGGGGSKAAADDGAKPAAKPEPKAAAPAPTKPAAPPSGTARAGKTPDRPAPTIPADAFAKADEHYENAKSFWNDRVRVLRNSEHGEAKRLAASAWEELQAVSTVLQDYTGWLEEADLGDWAIPAEYDALTRKLTKYDKLRIAVQKAPR